MPQQKARKLHIIRIALKLLIIAIIEDFWVNVLNSKVICICPLQNSIIIIGLILTFTRTPLQAL